MKPVDLLLIIGEMEGVCQHAKKLGFQDDLEVSGTYEKRNTIKCIINSRNQCPM